MLKKENRLLSNYEFGKTRKAGRQVSGKFFHLYYYKHSKYNGPGKVGIVVSNKFDKSAVRRNRVRRIYREAIRNNFDKIEPGYWIVIYPKFSSAGKKYEEINTDYSETLQKISFTE
jgi:ribonuclease P protein component